MRKKISRFSFGFLLVVLVGILSSSYRVFLLNEDSLGAFDMWEQGEQDAVLLLSGDKTIGLSHWSKELVEERNGQFFFEPSEVTLVFSCYPELLPEEVREKHVFSDSSGVQFAGVFGRVLILSKGVL